MARATWTTADWKDLYDSNPTFKKMYGSFEGFMLEIARRAVRDAKECGAWNKASPEMKAKARAWGLE